MAQEVVNMNRFSLALSSFFSGLVSKVEAQVQAHPEVVAAMQEVERVSIKVAGEVASTVIRAELGFLPAPLLGLADSGIQAAEAYADNALGLGQAQAGAPAPAPTANSIQGAVTLALTQAMRIQPTTPTPAPSNRMGNR
jgi:hypothetical protein